MFHLTAVIHSHMENWQNSNCTKALLLLEGTQSFSFVYNTWHLVPERVWFGVLSRCWGQGHSDLIRCNVFSTVPGSRRSVHIFCLYIMNKWRNKTRSRRTSHGKIICSFNVEEQRFLLGFFPEASYYKRVNFLGKPISINWFINEFLSIYSPNL